jgi:hypothetical protein
MFTNNILVKEQYGFRRNSSTEAASCNVINEILKTMNNRRSAGGTLRDWEKAFDCVDYGIVVDKMEFSRIGGKFQNLMQSYL